MVELGVKYFKLVGNKTAVVGRPYSFKVKWHVWLPTTYVAPVDLIMRWTINGEPQEDIKLDTLMSVFPSTGEKTIRIYLNEEGTTVIEAYPCLKAWPFTVGCLNEYVSTLAVNVVDESKVAILNITSNKEGVKVYIDGNEIGIAPITAMVEPGKHTIEVEGKDCYGKKEVEVSVGETKHVTVECGSTWEKYMIIAIAMIGLLVFIKMRGEYEWSQK